MEGYAKLSSCMSADYEFAIFRKFGALNLQNLLYYQAELMDLEEDLRVQVGVGPDSPMMRYNNKKVLRIANIISTVISSALPIASIAALNSITRTVVQLVVIAAFTMSFSLILTLMTNARRVENFAATAA
ncbi:hypothetical protein P7C71_g4665, partial [Lecanoromycetidae sp. Uapishka_2]